MKLVVEQESSIRNFDGKDDFPPCASSNAKGFGRRLSARASYGRLRHSQATTTEHGTRMVGQQLICELDMHRKPYMETVMIFSNLVSQIPTNQ